MNRLCKIFCLLLVLLLLGSGGHPAFAAKALRSDESDPFSKCGTVSDVVDRVRSLVKGGSLSPSDGESLLAPLLAACTQELPMAPLEDKLSEGLAKHVPTPLIVRALDQKVSEYCFAQSLLSSNLENVDPQLFVVVGEGLSKGVPHNYFESYVVEFSSQDPEMFLTGAEMTSYLGQAGFDYGLTRTMLLAGFESDALSSQWRYFIRLVLVARQRGLSDEKIGKVAAEVLAENGTLSDVSSKLGFTSRSLTGKVKSD